MYVETDFILALVKEEDWLQEKAEKLYEEHKENLWTSSYTLIELMILSYREEWNPVKIISGASNLVEVRGETEKIKAAAVKMEEKGYTPFDALHLISSGDQKIISSDYSYDKDSERLKLEEAGEE